MTIKNLLRNLTVSIMLVIVSPLLIMVRALMLLIIVLPFAVLEKTNRPYQKVMEETTDLLSF